MYLLESSESVGEFDDEIETIDLSNDFLAKWVSLG